MLINELSKRTGVSIHTLRFYENLGLIQGKSNPDVKTNNYKDYDEKLVKRVESIVKIKEVGFTLSEIKTILYSYDNDNLTNEERANIFLAKIKEVDEKIHQLNQAKQSLLKMKKDIEDGLCDK